MPEPKLKKALITTPYPTTREVAKFLHMPMARVEKLVAELREIQKENRQSVPGYPGYRGSAKSAPRRKSVKAPVTKRAGRAR